MNCGANAFVDSLFQKRSDRNSGGPNADLADRPFAS